MAKCTECKYYISDEFCEPYNEGDYDFEINGAYKEHNCPHFIKDKTKGDYY